MAIFSDARRRKLDEFRRAHAIESARLSPDERVRRADELRRAAPPGVRSTSDEPLDVMLRWKRRPLETR